MGYLSDYSVSPSLALVVSAFCSLPFPSVCPSCLYFRMVQLSSLVLLVTRFSTNKLAFYMRLILKKFKSYIKTSEGFPSCFNIKTAMLYRETSPFSTDLTHTTETANYPGTNLIGVALKLRRKLKIHSRVSRSPQNLESVHFTTLFCGGR